MRIEQIYTNCLAQGAYYVISENEAIIIDPLREVQPYINKLNADNVTLKYIFETHFHADFVSGHLDLHKKTKAPIVFGPNANPNFDFISAKDGEIFKFGKLKIKVIHTPGHTMESTCYLLFDENDIPQALFSGDTLFIGDVGRPDLAQKNGDMTKEKLASVLFKSLREKIMTLPDDIIVYPAHGAGSACGKNMSKETSSTLGIQKKTNYALRQNMTEKEFIKEVTDGLLPPPKYFGMNVDMNKKGYENIDNVLKKGNNPLNLKEFEFLTQERDILILDTRDNGEFCKGFIPNSINIGLNGDFAPWVGALIGDVTQKIVFISEIGKENEVVTRLSRVGFDNILGFLKGGFLTWQNAKKEIGTIKRISAEQLSKEFDPNKSVVFDVRKESEYEAEHIENAYSKPLNYINEWFNNINKNEHFYIHCAGGYRSMIAASILKSRGIENFSEIEGGFKAISGTNVPKTNFFCQSKTFNYS